MKYKIKNKKGLETASLSHFLHACCYYFVQGEQCVMMQKKQSVLEVTNKNVCLTRR